LSSIFLLLNVLFEKIGNSFNNEKYLLKRLKEIKDAPLEFDLQTRLVNLWLGIGQNSTKGDAYDPIYQKLDNKSKIFND